MNILKTGDPCPLCGEPIKSSDPDVLWLLSVYGAAIEKTRDKTAKRGKEIAEPKCSIHLCGKRKGPYCCAKCDYWSSCPDACLNSPDKCNCSYGTISL